MTQGSLGRMLVGSVLTTAAGASRSARGDRHRRYRARMGP